MNLESILNQYNYEYPKELIAQKPAHPRDSAKLLVFNRKTKQTSLDIFKNLGNYLPKDAVIVLNQTKVIPARFTVTKPTGGKATLLYISHDSHCLPLTKGEKKRGFNNSGVITVLSDRKLEIGSKLLMNKQTSFSVVDQHESHYLLKPSFPISKLYSVLEKYGRTPIPPYIKHSPLSESKLRSEYQTVFAKTKGSVAAPTASLHLTKPLLNRLKTQGVQIEYVTLHVNLGTFATLTKEQLKTGKLHQEHYEISQTTAKRLNKAKQAGKPIIAVGTTVVRTIESAVSLPLTKGERKISGEDFTEGVSALSGTTDLFIREGYNFKFVDGIITNFHVPKSSLLMLVSAFTEREKLLELYQLAIDNNFRLFSFGDGMMVL